VISVARKPACWKWESAASAQFSFRPSMTDEQCVRLQLLSGRASKSRIAASIMSLSIGATSILGSL